MYFLSQSIVFVAMALLTAVSMCTTYISLNDSILPEPVFSIMLPGGQTWNCSVFALALSVAIGLMLFALKLAIVGRHKRLNLAALLGMTVVAFISIAFNMDVLYRTADREFFIRFSAARMRSAYEAHLAETQRALMTQRDALRRDIATQQGELEAEIKGLRQAPSGYGRLAKEEDYRLMLLEKAAQVELDRIEAALSALPEIDARLRDANPRSLEEVAALENELRALARDPGVAAGLTLPPPVEQESPLFAVLYNLFDLKNIGIKEIFFLLIAFFLDLGDIIGYSLVPTARNKAKRDIRLSPVPPAENLLEYRTPVVPDAIAQPEVVPDPPERIDSPPSNYRRRRRHFRSYVIVI